EIRAIRHQAHERYIQIGSMIRTEYIGAPAVRWLLVTDIEEDPGQVHEGPGNALPDQVKPAVPLRPARKGQEKRIVEQVEEHQYQLEPADMQFTQASPHAPKSKRFF